MWGVKAPKRVSFIWTGAFGKILTCDNLMRRGMFWPVGVACVRAENIYVLDITKGYLNLRNEKHL